ncbi:glycoside hydrolase family 68 protein [Streptococcus sp. SQ9-PEA]|uniref:Glycoside hydrolase family 68 protein n=2 Tax=Streptococcus sciuri TaxID=2973939 RepID=A0ABT2F8F6_9STRE|nr:glycoside hydrolase family 68 protein [Streptococcus sciuri]MCS4488753.1 glycoside hydrolase family 68 protein [Streptococcus sciuri]
MKQEKRKYSIRKVSAVGVASALIGSIAFISTQAKADVVITTTEETPTHVDNNASTNDEMISQEENSLSVSETHSVVAKTQEATTNEVNTSGTKEDSTSPETVETTHNIQENAIDPVTDSNQTSASQVVETDKEKATSELSTLAVDENGLTDQAKKIAQEAGLDVTVLTDTQKAALNKIYMDSTAETGTQMTYKQFQEIADTLVAQDDRYAIPYFNAAAIKNMKAATTIDAQTKQIADLDVWDSWPVQDVKTGEVVNWNGYQLVVAMMGIPNTNDNHLYLLYNDYRDNDFDHWRNAGSIFGYGLDALTQQWSGSAIVNSDGTIQLYYTNVDTSDNNSNNQMLATATLALAVENGQVVIKSVDNNRILTPKGGDGYYYQSYKQWRSTFTGADNIAMRDPHVIEDRDGQRYLVFEASTGTQNYQGENQIYNWKNYGGDAAFNVSSLFDILANEDMYIRASFANAAIGIVRLSGNEKTPSIAQYYTPLLTSTMVSDEIERPNVVRLGDKYYLFAASRLNHGSNDIAWNKANDEVGDNVVMLGYVSDKLTSGYKPLNKSGVVLTASVPADWRTATYSYYAVPVEGSNDTLLVTAYMTNRNEVAGKGKNSTWAPSFLIKIFPDGTTRVLAKMTEQGDWIWDESSETQNTVGTLETSYLLGENDGYIDWNVIGGYNLKPHTPYTPDDSIPPHQTPDSPNTPTDDSSTTTPKNSVITSKGEGETPNIPAVAKASLLPSTSDSDNSLVATVGFVYLASMTAYVSYGGYKRKYR